MQLRNFFAALSTALAIGFSMLAFGLSATIARADADLHKVNHIIIVMQENRSFDHYFGALPYVPGGPYHGGLGFCPKNDHRCVDGLSCRVDSQGGFRCANANLDDDGSIVHSFHEQSFCVGPDLDHSWKGSHKELFFEHPALTRFFSPADGFVRQNDATTEGQPDGGVETPTDDDTMGFYTQDDLPFYYALAQTFAIDDRYFCSVIGQTFPNRSYLMAATSFGHLTTSEITPPPEGYKPITGTIMDLLDSNGVSWVDYFAEIPQSFTFRPSAFPFVTPHTQPLSAFLAQARTARCRRSPSSIRSSESSSAAPRKTTSIRPPTSGRARASSRPSSTRCGTARTGRTRSSSSCTTSTAASTTTSPRRGRDRASTPMPAIPTASIPACAPTCRTHPPARSRAAARTAA